MKKIIGIIFLCFFCFVTIEDVYAGGGYVSSGHELTYRIDSIQILNNKMDIKGWAYQENNKFDYVTKGTGTNQHYYRMNIGGKTYYDQNDFYVDHTALNVIVGQSTSKYQNVGFHFIVDLDDLYASGHTKFTLDLEIYHQNRKAESISLSYLTGIDTVVNDAYKIEFDTSSNPVSIYANVDYLYVNKTPTKGDYAMSNSYPLYFTRATPYSIASNTLTGKTYYDATNKVYWYEVRYSVDKLDGNRMRVLPNSTGTLGWVCDPHMMYAGDPTLMTLSKNTHTIQYETFSDLVLKPQIKVANQSIKIYEDIPFLEGNVFSSWNTKADGSGKNYSPGNTYTENENVILYAIYTNAYPTITGPIIGEGNDSDLPPQLDGEDLVIQLGDTFNPLDYVEANDKEDGNITDRIEIETNYVPLNNEQITTTPGSFEVTVKVTDKGGATVKKKFVVLVNDAPVIEATERWFVAGWVVDYYNLISKVKAYDLEDGDLSDKIEILSIEYSDGRVDESVVFFDTALEQNIEHDKALITYRVVDQYNKETTSSVYLNIYFDYALYDDGLNVRYIDDKSLNSLCEQSIWITNELYQQSLQTSLNKEQDDTVYHFSFTSNDVSTLKGWLLNHSPSKDANVSFVTLLANGVNNENSN